MSTLERAIQIATEAHKGQLDKAGRDYIGHPLRVMEMGKTKEEKIVGVLHDVVEDGDWTFEALEAEGFSKDVKRLKKYLKAYKKLTGEPVYSVYAARHITNMKQIFFAGGCFWGTEHYMGAFEGVIETETGYANGDLAEPTYQQVYTDKTGHVECVRVSYDDGIISLATLCRLFFRSINPLSINRQGNDCGTRYRTGIYWIDEADRADVEKVYEEVQQAYGEPLAVEKGPLKSFYPAEEYHQDYLVKNPEGYCHLSLSTLRLAKEYGEIMRNLIAASDEEKKIVLPRFFKTGKGQYGEGDKFLGVTVPETRKVAKAHKEASYELIEALLESEWHECRLCALLILIEKYKKDPEAAVKFYLTHLKGINNWDLVDLSAPYILGDYLVKHQDHSVLYTLAQSPVMWEQRIAVVSTLMLIRHGQFADTIELAEIFLGTKHDLTQKAVGWMLREVGKRDKALLMSFLNTNKGAMPRTTLRYAIEKFSAEEKKELMRK